ncbi:MAG: molybdopterin-dependent oxidoreductase [Pirellulaceae bacterium]
MANEATVQPLLSIGGEVEKPGTIAFADLAGIDAAHQVADLSRLVPGRQGDAVRLAGLLALAGPKATARWLGLHASRDNFHASIPLASVTDKALVIYRLAGEPLPETAGGPFRFFIPDFAVCQTHEIDECANVKFVDRIELTADKGFDNRPHDGAEHEALHAKE